MHDVFPHSLQPVGQAWVEFGKRFEEVPTGVSWAGLPCLKCEDGQLFSKLVTRVVLEAASDEAVGDEQLGLGVIPTAGDGSAAGDGSGRKPFDVGVVKPSSD